MRTQRPSVFVPGRWFTVDTATRAGFGARLGAAGAADPDTVEDLAQRHDASAARTGRTDNAVGPGVDERVYQPQHRRHRGVSAGAGEHLGAIVQLPSKVTPLSGPGGDRAHGLGHGCGVEAGVNAGDHVDEELYRVTALIRWTRVAARLPLPVPRGDLADVPATDTRRRDETADSAVPVLSTALQGAQVLAASGADRGRDAHRTCIAQCDQQAPNNPGSLRAPVGEQAGPLSQCLGQAPAHVPARSDDSEHIGDHRAIQSRLDLVDQCDHDTERVGQHLRRMGGHRLLAVPGDTCTLGPQIADTRPAPRPASTGRSPLAGTAARSGDGFDQLTHRAVQDVEQRHQNLQAQPLGPFDDEAVDLAGGQPDPTTGQRVDQIGGGEHAPVGHHLPQMPPVAQFACHQISSPSWVLSGNSCAAGTSNAGPSALRSAVFMKSELTWV